MYIYVNLVRSPEKPFPHIDDYEVKIGERRETTDLTYPFHLQGTSIHVDVPVLLLVEGTVSQISYLGPSFYLMPKIKKHCEKMRKNIF